MVLSCSAWAIASLLLIGAAWPASAQTIIDDSLCAQSGFQCPRDHDPSYAKYCCLQRDGGYTLLTCCNPYFGLTVGLCITVPLILGTVIMVIACMCICAYSQKRKLNHRMRSYYAQRSEVEVTQQQNPPPYASDGGGAMAVAPLELPPYTEQDAYKTEKEGEQVASSDDIPLITQTEEQ